jgi:hypothetical protein
MPRLIVDCLCSRSAIAYDSMPREGPFHRTNGILKKSEVGEIVTLKGNLLAR